MNGHVKDTQEQLELMHIDALRWKALVNAFSKGDTGVWYSGITVNFCFHSPTEIEIETRITTYLDVVDLKEVETPKEFKARVLTTWVDNLIQKGKTDESSLLE